MWHIVCATARQPFPLLKKRRAIDMKILRVDICNEKVTFENLKEEWQSVGGSGFIAKVMSQEVPPATDPLGPENLFIVAIGPLAGTGAPQLGRISVGSKSPLTLGIKEANSGGPAAHLMIIGCTPYLSQRIRQY
jgi:aldehyde:ferredoxin oxidoreductase